MKDPKPFYCYQKKCVDKAKKSKDKKSKAFMAIYLKETNKSAPAKDSKMAAPQAHQPSQVKNADKASKVHKTPHHERETHSVNLEKPKGKKKSDKAAPTQSRLNSGTNSTKNKRREIKQGFKFV